MCLSGVTHDDAEYFSRLAGTTTVLSSQQSNNRPILVPWATSGNKSIGESQRPLITPDELTRMEGEILVVSKSRPPIKARQRPYFLDRRLKRLVPDLRESDPLDRMGRASTCYPPLKPVRLVAEVQPALATKSEQEQSDPVSFAIAGDGRISRQSLKVRGAENDGKDASQSGLTDGDKRLLKLLAQGASKEEIGGKLQLPTYGVSGTLGDLFLRLGVADRAQAVELASRIGLMGHDEDRV